MLLPGILILLKIELQCDRAILGIILLLVGLIDGEQAIAVTIKKENRKYYFARLLIITTLNVNIAYIYRHIFYSFFYHKF
jgi:hypothetical protein